MLYLPVHLNQCKQLVERRSSSSRVQQCHYSQYLEHNPWNLIKRIAWLAGCGWLLFVTKRHLLRTLVLRRLGARADNAAANRGWTSRHWQRAGTLSFDRTLERGDVTEASPDTDSEWIRKKWETGRFILSPILRKKVHSFALNFAIS